MFGDVGAVGVAVDLWLAFYDEIVDPALLAELRRLMTPEEREQEDRYRFADDRKRYRVTRALVRTALSLRAAVEPEDWVFVTNDYGCPRVADVHGAAAQLSFNVSHTRGLVALAVTQERALGVDVENVAAREVSTGIADRFFAPVEVDGLAAVAPQRRQERFFEYWTMKESYIKARGMGLSIPLDKFSFRFPGDDAVHLAIDPELGDDAARWSFLQYRPTPAHLLALCVERRGPSPEPLPRVTIRKVVPTRGHEPLELPIARKA
ncbi:MAG TPA: 4'-phosphopantetheinyl transferase superfamily protein [Xanthomonadales bacterium]|nr:4'-phosphopantetheinyl transferase superfamily protein [Xanthomonadales bacterium]